MDIGSLSYSIKYKANNKTYTANADKCEHFSLETTIENDILSVTLHPKTAVSFLSFDIIMPYTFKDSDRIFVNGYQSWTDSLEYAPDGKMSELTRITEFVTTKTFVKNIGLPKSGDSLFWKYPRKSGIFYGWSYGYVRNGQNVNIFGTLSERYGYTVITFDCRNNNVIISKELEGVTYDKDSKILAFTEVSGEYESAFDEYFKRINVKSLETKRRTGYTTWYNYYGNVNEEVVNRDLNSIAKQSTHFDCFQIDDGHQKHIGDWLITDEKKFPSGMKTIAENIHKVGLTAGLWIAPFAAVKQSELFIDHPDWFIKDKHGKPYNTGHNWGGFYSLDIYNKDARAYIKHVFDVILNDWGYDLVKLDFLYGACVLPIHNKTRGEIMCDAMDFIRECCGDKLILGCGVPMFPSFGKVDYCRIGADVCLSWERRTNITRDDVSTPHSVSNTIFRRHLNGRAFMNDPDVFHLRDNNIGMPFKTRKLLATINSIFGSLLFTSDNLDEYGKEQAKALKEAFSEKTVKINSAEFIKKDIMDVSYLENGIEKHLRFNVQTGEEIK